MVVGDGATTTDDSTFAVSPMMATSDDYWKISTASIEEMTKKYEYRIKSNKMEMKRRALMAEKIAWDAIDHYCTEVVKRKYFDSQDV